LPHAGLDYFLYKKVEPDVGGGRLNSTQFL
jgi:hypothetical protein